VYHFKHIPMHMHFFKHKAGNEETKMRKQLVSAKLQ